MTGFWLVALALPCVLAGQERSFAWTDRYVLGIEEDLSAGLTFADVDGDGDMDALVANGRHWPQPNEVFVNNGAARFTVSYQLGPRSATTYAIPAGDLDGDGDPDVVVANDLAENWVYLNDGTGHFEAAWPVGPEIEPTRSAQLHDLEGDGDLDLLITNRGASNGLFLNDGSGRFGPKREFGEPRGSTIAVAVGDVDGDGDPDWPFLEATVSMLRQYPNLYVDISFIDWQMPRRLFYDYLEGLILYGFEKRIMFGTDQNWPDAIAVAVQGIEEAPFLSAARDATSSSRTRCGFSGFERTSSRAADRPAGAG